MLLRAFAVYDSYKKQAENAQMEHLLQICCHPKIIFKNDLIILPENSGWVHLVPNLSSMFGNTKKLNSNQIHCITRLEMKSKN